MLRNVLRTFVAVIALIGASRAALGQPINDLCTCARPVGDGEYRSTNVGAGTDGPAAHPIYHDVWYIYRATCAGTLHIDTCDFAAENYIAAYKGTTCSNLVYQAGVNTCTPYGGSINVALNFPNDIVYIRHGSRNGQSFTNAP